MSARVLPVGGVLQVARVALEVTVERAQPRAVKALAVMVVLVVPAARVRSVPLGPVLVRRAVQAVLVVPVVLVVRLVQRVVELVPAPISGLWVWAVRVGRVQRVV